MSGIIADGSAETIQALDHGAGFAVLGNSRGSVVAGQPAGVGVIGVFGAPFAQAFPTGIGVAGLSDISNGVHGINGKGASTKLEVGSGVLGESENGNGVSGVSEHAVGVFGKGRVAGRFEGDVNVNGKLLVNGSDIVERIQLLENLLQRLFAQPRIPSPGGHPSISVVHESNPDLVIVSGRDFTPGSVVRVRFTTDNGQSHKELTQMASQFGDFDLLRIAFPFINPQGNRIFIAATDGRLDRTDFEGLLWSNTVSST
ncbi:MAG: hypothetical protein JWO38_4959 [Gemmataceae bacterium]|nr:hypothetical protein [Gemmataceae bacterium]